ncbi:hypothetical protein QNM97_09265 [Gordonia sp. L191]|uniref:hypothetical protein n=1 Tax=Gordonia sp. L191 TaxID=2982699 RepID=UPI0024C023D0|nr:hypothetical protein [Gordonia sp. L191]WHU49137.1 hypothetical protein QNM97_09265 [Gordonia sp. L191]
MIDVIDVIDEVEDDVDVHVFNRASQMRDGKDASGAIDGCVRHIVRYVDHTFVTVNLSVC